MSNVFLIGSGLIGGAVLDLLLKDGNFKVKVLVRNEDSARKLEYTGAVPVLGSLDQESLITSTTSDSDIIIHAGGAGDLPSVSAIMAGIKLRAENGKQTIYLHTSGAGIVMDGAAGMSATDKIFSDLDPNDIDSTAAVVGHPFHQVDSAILSEWRQSQSLGDQAKIAIIMPPLIYGVSKGRLSMQGPGLVRFALKEGFSGHVGDGKSIWSQIHVGDLSKGYMTILGWMQSKGTSKELSDNPYFYIENGHEQTWGELASHIGTILHSEGKLSSPEARKIPKDMYNSLFGPFTEGGVGSNCRVRADRLLRLGWRPSEKGLWESLEKDEIPLILRQS